jgi:hypothetical protein
MDHVAHGSDLVGEQSIAVKGEDHLVGIPGRTEPRNHQM